MLRYAEISSVLVTTTLCDMVLKFFLTPDSRKPQRLSDLTDW